MRSHLAGLLVTWMCLSASLCGIAIAGCTTTAISPAYTHDELKDLCERRGGRWHEDGPMRSYCEYNSMS